MATSSLPRTTGDFPGLQPVDATLVGENQQAVLAEAGDDLHRRVLLLRGDALEALPATVLNAEVVHRHVAHVSVLGQRDDDGALFDEVLAVHGQGHRVDFATPIVPMPLHQRVEFREHDAQTAFALGKNVL